MNLFDDLFGKEEIINTQNKRQRAAAVKTAAKRTQLAVADDVDSGYDM